MKEEQNERQISVDQIKGSETHACQTVAQVAVRLGALTSRSEQAQAVEFRVGTVPVRADFAQMGQDKQGRLVWSVRLTDPEKPEENQVEVLYQNTGNAGQGEVLRVYGISQAAPNGKPSFTQNLMQATKSQLIITANDRRYVWMYEGNGSGLFPVDTVS